MNQSLTPLDVTDPVLRSRRAHEATHLEERVDHSVRLVLEPRSDGFAPRITPSTPATTTPEWATL